ncbi:MAG: KxYKxGKxW signal peptide domain-containing protein [Tepidimonas ignava]
MRRYSGKSWVFGCIATSNTRPFLKHGKR